MAMGLILAGYPTAKQQLIDSGMDPAKVEAMPVGQVVAIHIGAPTKGLPGIDEVDTASVLAVVSSDACHVCRPAGA